MYISFAEAGVFVLFVLAAIVGVYMIVVLHKIAKTLNQVQGILTQQEPQLTKTMALLPLLLENINEMVLQLKSITGVAADLETAIASQFLTTVENLQQSLQAFGSLTGIDRRNITSRPTLHCPLAIRF